MGWVGSRWPNHLTISKHLYGCFEIVTRAKGDCTFHTSAWRLLLRNNIDNSMLYISAAVACSFANVLGSLRRLSRIAFVPCIPPIRFILSFSMADSAPRIFLPAQDADPGLPLPPLAPAAPAPAKISRITEMKRKIIEQSIARVKAACANGLA